jgi:hypothetical protein
MVEKKGIAIETIAAAMAMFVLPFASILNFL